MPYKFFITIKTVSIVPLNRNEQVLFSINASSQTFVLRYHLGMGSFSILTTEKGTSAFTDAFTILTLIALIALTPPASVLTEPVNALTLSALVTRVAPTLVFTEAVITLILNTLLH